MIAPSLAKIGKWALWFCGLVIAANLVVVDMLAFVVVNTGSAALLRASAIDVEPECRAAAIAMTAQMIGVWLYHRRLDG